MYDLFTIILFIAGLFKLNQGDFDKFVWLVGISALFAIAGAVCSISNKINSATIKDENYED